MYVKVLTVTGSKTLAITCKHVIAPIGEKVFAVLGSDRILYTPIDGDIGKEYAVRVVKGTAWNVTKVKPHKIKDSIAYTIPKNFAQTLGIHKGEKVLVIGKENVLEVIPVNTVIEKVGKFREPTL
ncbi:hypothetical protein [Pyrococcus kukulkanii]|uniref:hypothetical protein n=1 Tax=Pyrococcus kukulkanii TaxID=1609559 RepID=UPI0035621F47